jgi:hypothetical protein
MFFYTFFIEQRVVRPVQEASRCKPFFSHESVTPAAAIRRQMEIGRE